MEVLQWIEVSDPNPPGPMGPEWGPMTAMGPLKAHAPPVLETSPTLSRLLQCPFYVGGFPTHMVAYFQTCTDARCKTNSLST